MIARHVGQHGYVCPGDGPEHPAHPTRDLTLDHVVALIDGGAPFDPANTRVLCRSRNSANGARLVNARRADRGSPHAGSALLEVRASQSCARGRVSPKYPVVPTRDRGSPTGATRRRSGAMTTAVTTHATERGRAPGWRPGPEGRLAAAVLSGVALGARRQDERLAGAPAPGPDRLGRRDGLRFGWSRLGGLAGEGRLAQRVRVLVPVRLAQRGVRPMAIWTPAAIARCTRSAWTSPRGSRARSNFRPRADSGGVQPTGVSGEAEASLYI